MEWAQVLTIIGANLAVILTILKTTNDTIIHMNRRIDAMYQEPKKNKGKRK